MDCRDSPAGAPGIVGQAAASGPRPPPDTAGFSHAALLYSSEHEYRTGIAAFLRAAAAAAAPVHAAVPKHTMRLVRETFRFLLPQTSLADMTGLGSNPARIIPVAQSFADEHPGAHIYCLWEPAWPGRSPAELREVARHEALCNLAFSGRPMTVLCLYDTARLGGQPIVDAGRTHPLVTAHGHNGASPNYLGPGRFPDGSDDPLPPPAPRAQALAFRDQLGRVREFAASHARAAGLGAERVADLVLAVSEIAANALGHAAGGGTIRTWCTSTEFVCQLDDAGYITDPLAGRSRQPADAAGGHGLWLVNKICDLVERRSGPAGTSTRLHMRRPAMGLRPSEA